VVNRLSINSVSCELGLGGMPNLQALNQILHISKEKGLPIYFDVEIYGVETSNELKPIINEDGSITKVMVGVSPDYFDDELRKLIVAPRDSDNFNIIISTFNYGNKNYHSVDKTGMALDCVVLNYSRVYCIRDELDEYLRSIGLIDELLIPEQQRQVLKKLIDEKGVGYLLSLGRKGCWEELQTNSDLFNTGKSAMGTFFSANTDLISAFKKGRRKKT